VVTGAGGGSGLAAVETGAAIGAEVVAVARGPERLQVARAAGATHLIEADDPDLRARLRALGGADVVYDAVGGAAGEAALGALRPGARVLTIGFASGEVPRVRANHLMVKNAELIGVYWGGMWDLTPGVVAGSVAALMGMWGRGEIAPRIDRVLALEAATDGLALLRRRRATGKIVVRVDPDSAGGPDR
jgi:NADPH2:quinone reductase